MKYYYSKNELYPVYELKTDSDWSNGSIDIPEELYNEFIETMKKFDEVQDKIHILVEQKKKKIKK